MEKCRNLDENLAVCVARGGISEFRTKPELEDDKMSVGTVILYDHILVVQVTGKFGATNVPLDHLLQPVRMFVDQEISMSLASTQSDVLMGVRSK